MTLKALTGQQIEEFVENGFTLLRDAFPRSVADAVRREVVRRAGADEDDPKTWTEVRKHIADAYSEPMFMAACTGRFYDAVDDVMGVGRWVPLNNLGWWPVLFPGFDTPPWRALHAEWHIDGGFFHHHLDSPEQGLLPLFIFSDIEAGDGGTAVRVGSHKAAACILHAARPVGLTQAQLGRAVSEACKDDPIIEVQGRAGDVMLVHPFVLHTVSTNIGKKVRVICNPHICFKERMNVTGEAGKPVSPVERAIVEALPSFTSIHGSKMTTANTSKAM